MCVGRLYNFMQMDMHRLEFPEEYPHKVTTFLISDSFLSSHMPKEVTGNTFVQCPPLKWLNVDVIKFVQICYVIYKGTSECSQKMKLKYAFSVNFLKTFHVQLHFPLIVF